MGEEKGAERKGKGREGWKEGRRRIFRPTLAEA